MTRLARRALLLVAFSLLTSAATAHAEGWYLLAPPWRTAIKEGEDELDTKAPLTRWEQIGAFDTAQICENSKHGIIERLEKGDKERLDRAAKALLGRPRSDPLQTKEGQEYAKWAFGAIRARASRCVSISDPRLHP